MLTNTHFSNKTVSVGIHGEAFLQAGEGGS